MHLDEIVSRFQNVKKIGDKSYQCTCNSHKDDKASLTITEEDNKILMYCHAGCDTKDILRAAGLTEKDLFNNNPINTKPKIVKEYYYTDENNKPLYKVVRYEPKSFVQAKYDNGNWVFKMAGVRYVLYNLHNVIKSDNVYFVEGEKDADNLNSIGLVATTTAGGASGFKKRAKEYCEFLRGKSVFIIPDNDKPGQQYAEDIQKALSNIAKEVKILKLVDAIPDLKEKSDISDILQQYGKEKTLEILENLKKNGEKTPEVIAETLNLNKNTIFSADLFEKLYKEELNNIENFFEIYSQIKEYCRTNRITGFDKNYKLYKEAKKEKYIYPSNIMVFDEVNKGTPYNSGRYELSSDNFIYELVPNVGKILVSYQPVLPICRYINIENGLEKIKIAFLVNNEWKTLIVDKSIISSSQAIIKLSDLGLEVTSENSKALVKFLSEIGNLNKDIIKIYKFVSRMGWFGKELLPYSDDLEFDNEKEIPNLKEKFSESGNLEDWIEFFKERRKYNPISRIIMAAAVSSILLNRIKQSGFTLHIWGESEYGKAQPLNTKIITPYGYKFMKDIKIGDYVIGGDGKQHKVIGVYPQGKKEVYEITFKDGRKTKCCKEHLWNVTTKTTRSHNRGYKTIELKEMLKKPIKIKNDYNFRIPTTKPVEFYNNKKLPINPYLLGALIGDGCLTLKLNKANNTRNIYFSNSEDDVINKVENHLKDIGVSMHRNIYTTNQFILSHCKKLKQDIIDLKLNCESSKRFIPKIYKIASVKDRIELLQGLIDTDGHITAKGSIRYSTKSKQLANDVLDIAYSLGYRATIIIAKNREEEYTVTICANDTIFSSKKHKRAMEYANKNRKRIENTNDLSIISIEKCGYEECQCLMIDSEEHTYLCDDFIVTHNTVACMVGQSIFGNPSQNDGKGIGINFNFTNVGLEYRLNLYNNIPLFVNEMQHQKDAKDYDKMLFLISEGKGRTRSTKLGGLAKENTWNNIVITNGEKNIMKNNSNAGAYNRCLSYEINKYSFENLPETADFVKENYGTPIREILNNLDKFDCKKLFNDYLKGINNNLTTNKQKILEAIILLGDKIVTDVLFKDGYYLKLEDIEKGITNKMEIAVEERAYEYIKDWYISEKRHFLSSDLRLTTQEDMIKVEIYGKEVEDDYVAFIPSILRKKLEDGGFDYNEVLNAWKRKSYLKHASNRNTISVRINGSVIRCVVLNLNYYNDDEEVVNTNNNDFEGEELPF